jgi:hypothetical protein
MSTYLVSKSMTVICLDCAVARFEQWAGAGVVRRIAHPDPDAEPRVLLGSGFAGNQTNANATRTVAFLMQSTVWQGTKRRTEDDVMLVVSAEFVVAVTPDLLERDDLDPG